MTARDALRRTADILAHQAARGMPEAQLRRIRGEPPLMPDWDAYGNDPRKPPASSYKPPVRRLDNPAPVLSFAERKKKTSAEAKHQAQLAKGRAIIAAACKACNVRESDLLGTRKHGHLVLVRQIAIHIMRSMTDLSSPDIGQLLHRDHTTILHALAVLVETRQFMAARQRVLRLLPFKMREGAR